MKNWSNWVLRFWFAWALTYNSVQSYQEPTAYNIVMTVLLVALYVAFEYVELRYRRAVRAVAEFRARLLAAQQRQQT